MKKLFSARKARKETENKKRQKLEDCIGFVVSKTDWDYKKAKQEIENARSKYGISFKDYMKYEFYDVPEERQEIAFRKIQDKKTAAEYEKNRKKSYINSVAKATGWDTDTVKEKMNDAIKKLGINSWIYTYYEYYRLSDEEMAEAYERYKAKQDKKQKKNVKNTEKCIKLTMDAKGVSREEAEKMLEDARYRTGCTLVEYVTFKMYEVDEKTQDSIFLLYHTDRIRRKYDDNIEIDRIIVDKKVSNEYFKKYTKRKWCLTSEMDFDTFRDTFQGCSKLFYKPKSSSWGRGARPIDLTDDNCREVFDELKSMDEGVVEEYIVQHHKMQEMSPTAVSTLRIATISSDKPVDSEGNCINVAYAMMKMGGATGCVDNLHGGGVGAAIDLETGMLCTDAVDDFCNTYTHHPVTGAKIKGFEVPYFKEAVELVTDAIKEFDMHGYFGWDVSITENGPMLIEINGRPGPTLLVLPYYATEGKGMKSYMEKYM